MSLNDDSKHQKPKSVLGSIWDEWARRKDKGRSAAYIRLQKDFAFNHDDIVPHFATEKEFVAMVADLEPHTMTDQQSDSGNPMTLMASWLRGDIELSKMRMVKDEPIQ